MRKRGRIALLSDAGPSKQVTRHKELAMWTVLQDLRFSFRQMTKNFGFTLTAVSSLALGIGATTAIFSVLYAGLLYPYPYRDADRIVALTVYNKDGGRSAVNPNGWQIEALQESPVLEKVLTTRPQAMNATGREFPENVAVVAVDGDTFDDLGVPPLFGRGILPSDTTEGPRPAAVLSYKFWRRHFLGDPNVLGRTLELDHKDYQIVGVAGPRFTWATADVYQPLKLTEDANITLLVWLRLKPGVTYETARAALQPTVEQFAREMPKKFPKNFEVNIESLNAWAFRRIGGTVYGMFAAVLLLLVIGCVNVSILLLAQGTARQHELAVRAAIGAARGRIVRQLLTESLLLAAIGAAFGVWLSYAMLAGIRLLLPPYAFPSEAVIHINLPVLLFSVGVALATGMLFGVWPALQLSRTPAGQIIQCGAPRMTASVRSRRAHNLLIASQIAMTLLILAASGSAMKEFLRMLHRPLGYEPNNVMSVGIPLHRDSYTSWEARANYFAQLRAKAAETPGVTAAAISLFSNPPRSGWDGQFQISGKPTSEPQMASVHLVSSEYFAVLHIPLLQGRPWNGTEDHIAAPVALINRTFAQRYFPSEDALTHSLKLKMVGDPQILEGPNRPDSWLQIIGVVDDFLDDGMINPVQPAILVPYAYSLPPGIQLLIRTSAPPLTLVRAVKTQLAQVNPDQQTQNNIEELAAWISNGPEWQREHLAAWIFGIFAVLALVLAAVGLYSVVSYSLVQRTNEFGIRMALGAQKGNLLRLIVLSVFTSIAGGIVAGVGLSMALSTLISKWTQGSVREPGILFAGVVVLAVVAAVACVIPARRAAGIDPMAALRAE
jgi:predicted permease